MKRAGGLGAATLLTTIVLAACGSSSSGLLPARDAARLESHLSALDDALSAHSCDGVQIALNRLSVAIDELPDSVASKLRDNLLRGYDDLDDTARTQCHATSPSPSHTHGATGPSHATGTTTGPAGTTTSPAGTTTSPAGTTTSPTGPTLTTTSPTGPTSGSGGGTQAPGSTGSSGDTEDGGGGGVAPSGT